MATVNEQTLESRKKLVDAAVTLVIMNGQHRLTMKAIAREARVSDVEAYRCFASKDQLLENYWVQRADQALMQYHHTDGLEEFNTLEKMQLLIDTFIEVLLPDREFVAYSIRQFSTSSRSIQRGRKPLLKAYHQAFDSILEQAYEKENYSRASAQTQVCDMLAHYLLVVVMFWLRDHSEGFKRTTTFVELSLNFIDSILKSGSLNELHELQRFLLKPVMLGLMGPFEALINRMRQMRDAMGKSV